MSDMITPQDNRETALARRYGAEAIPPAGPWNAVIEGLLAHRSVRGYRPDALPGGTLATLVAAAQSAATSSNLQTWSVVAVTDPAARAEIARACSNQKHIVECPLFLVWCADLSRNARLGADTGTDLPAIPWLETFLVAAIDAALAAQNAVVAAESLGLSTVYIGALRNEPETVKRLLDLPDGCMGLFGLCVGHAAPGAEGAVKPRLPQDAVLFQDRYGNPDEPALRAVQDRAMEVFAAEQGMAESSWTKRVLARLGSVEAMGGRHALKATLRRMGFPLR
jgi:nitroreductase